MVSRDYHTVKAWVLVNSGDHAILTGWDEEGKVKRNWLGKVKNPEVANKLVSAKIANTNFDAIVEAALAEMKKVSNGREYARIVEWLYGNSLRSLKSSLPAKKPAPAPKPAPARKPAPAPKPATKPAPLPAISSSTAPAPSPVQAPSPIPAQPRPPQQSPPVANGSRTPAPGDIATIHSLRTITHFNGQHGVVTRYAPNANGQFLATLRLANGQEQVFFPQNVSCVAPWPAGFKPGDSVQLHGLVGTFWGHLNGQVGTVLSYLSGDKTFNVRLADGNTGNFYPKNLILQQLARTPPASTPPPPAWTPPPPASTKILCGALAVFCFVLGLVILGHAVCKFGSEPEQRRKSRNSEVWEDP